MVELQAVGILIAAAGIAVIAVNSVVTGRRLLNIRESKLKARRVQLRLQLISYMTDKRFEGALNEILWRWDDYWEKMEPIARKFRERNDYPGYLEPVEYLAEEVAKLRERKGDPKPKPLRTPRGARS